VGEIGANESPKPKPSCQPRRTGGRLRGKTLVDARSHLTMHLNTYPIDRAGRMIRRAGPGGALAVVAAVAFMMLLGLWGLHVEAFRLPLPLQPQQQAATPTSTKAAAAAAAAGM